jgi:predicted Zn-dependent protease
MMLFTLAEGKTLEEAAQTVIKNYGLQVSENNKTTINGNPAIAMIAKQAAEGQAAPAANAAQIASWLIQYNGNIYAIHGVSASTDFGSNFNQFKSVAQGYKSITDQSKLNREPERIRIKTAQRDGTLRDVLKDASMPDNKMEDLAILNGMALTDKVQKGMLFKTLGR